jgi:mannose-6-phosphate isomerase-like protein (cupin superfamily)
MLYGKVWGDTRIVFSGPQFEVHLLHILPNARCSMHRHNHKRNVFSVIYGRLWIDVRKKAYALTDVTELGPGEETEVPAGEAHRFRTGDEPTLALEIYYPEPLTEDIVREDHGGLDCSPTGFPNGPEKQSSLSPLGLVRAMFRLPSRVT